MKKIVLFMILLMFVSFAFAAPWSHRYDTWQTAENPSIDTGDTQTFAVEWGEGGWTSTSLGYGTSTDGSGWTWVNMPWIEDGASTNKRCSTTVTFNTQGTYYYVYKMVKDASDYHNDGNSTWDESTTDFASIATNSSVTVTDVPLPVTLASFTAKAKMGKVELAWTTESETENSHFLVYRNGEVITQIEGNGTTTEQHSYTFLDTRVQGGIHSYAIADVSYGGVEEMHDAVVVEVGAEIAEANFILNKAYPNPFNPRVTLSMELAFAQGYGESGYGAGGNVILNIYNAQGYLVENLINGFVEAGTHEISWDASHMTSGVYIVKMVVGNVMQSQKLVLMK